MKKICCNWISKQLYICCNWISFLFRPKLYCHALLWAAIGSQNVFLGLNIVVTFILFWASFGSLSFQLLLFWINCRDKSPKTIETILLDKKYHKLIKEEENKSITRIKDWKKLTKKMEHNHNYDQDNPY